MPPTYTAKEFADLAGVSKRTLYYYDECGLLKPSTYQSGNHRRYQPTDLMRLQQILTLKYMGFSLKEIESLLNSPAYNIRKSLEIQKEALHDQIQQLQQVTQAIEQTLDELDAMPLDELDWGNVSQLIHRIVQTNKNQWARQYYSTAEWQQLEAQGKQITPEQLIEYQHQWKTLIEGFKAKRHLPPDHPDFTLLVEQYQALIQGFTQGNEGIRAGLIQMYSNLGNIPAEYRFYDADTQNFIREVLTCHSALDS